jgi:hypothetical protein
MKRRRAGASETFGISVSPATKRVLKAAARRKHGGNVSALIEELAEGLKRQEAFERLWKWYGGPELSDQDRLALDAEIIGKKPAGRRKRKAA